MTSSIEPVHPRARLRRSPHVLYTEVGGAPVLCNTDDRSVHAFNAATVLLWSGFDGRPLAEVAGDAGGGPDQEGWRTLLEVVRRFKATGLIEDVPAAALPAAEPDPGIADLGLEAPAPTSLLVLGAWAEAPTDVPDQAGVLALLPAEGETSEVEVEPGGRGPVGEVRPTRIGGRVLAGVTVPESLQVSAHTGRELMAFVAWVRAVVDVDELRRPGVVDALAGLAESVPVVVPD